MIYYSIGYIKRVLTVLPSRNCVTCTMTRTLCCRIMRQKSMTLSGFGPCVAMYSFFRV